MWGLVSTLFALHLPEAIHTFSGVLDGFDEAPGKFRQVLDIPTEVAANGGVLWWNALMLKHVLRPNAWLQEQVLFVMRVECSRTIASQPPGDAKLPHSSL